MDTLKQVVNAILKVNKFSDNDSMTALLEVIDYKGDDVDIDDISDCHDLYDTLDYDGSLHERIDGLIDIYYHSLREWSVYNYGYIEEAIEEGLCEGVFDFHKLIQMGQYMYYREEMNEAVQELFNEVQEML
jgi:hypothetical protein